MCFYWLNMIHSLWRKLDFFRRRIDLYVTNARSTATAVFFLQKINHCYVKTLDVEYFFLFVFMNIQYLKTFKFVSFFYFNEQHLSNFMDTQFLFLSLTLNFEGE